MRRAHNKATKFLLNAGHELVYIIPHVRWDTITYLPSSKIKSKDIAGLFDGVSIKSGVVYWLQIKANKWPKTEQYENWASKYGQTVLLINVRDKIGVSVRTVRPEGQSLA